MLAPPLFVPPRPEAPKTAPGGRGFLRLIRSNALRIWPEAAYEEDTIRQGFFGLTWHLLNAPEAIHHVLVGNPGNYRRTAASVRMLRPIVGDGLLLSEGEAWKHQRHTIAPALAPRVMPVLARHIASAAAEQVAALKEREGEPVPLVFTMQRLALEIAGRSMFSLETARFGGAMRDLLTEFGMRHAGPGLLDMVLPAKIPSPRDLGRARFRRRWTALIDRIVADRLAAPPAEHARDLFDLLRAASDPETGAALDAAQLRDQVATMIVAGHETTATAMFWALYLLANAPAEQARMAAEVAGIEFAPETAAEQLGRLPYTRAVVNETLRLYPSAFALARQAIRADRAGSIDLPRNAVVMISPWVLHRHRKLWRDPDAFDPVRFLPDAPPPPRFAYMPFGAGPRICVGAQFALAEAAIVLAMLVQAFEIELDDPHPVLPSAVLVLQPNYPVTFRLRQRDRSGRRHEAIDTPQDPC